MSSKLPFIPVIPSYQYLKDEMQKDFEYRMTERMPLLLIFGFRKSLNIQGEQMLAFSFYVRSFIKLKTKLLPR